MFFLCPVILPPRPATSANAAPDPPDLSTSDGELARFQSNGATTEKVRDMDGRALDSTEEDSTGRQTGSARGEGGEKGVILAFESHLGGNGGRHLRKSFFDDLKERRGVC